MKLKNPKLLLALTAILIVIIGGGLAVWKFKNKPSTDSQEEPQKKRIAEPTNVIPVSERPYIQIAPLADGRNLVLLIKHLNKPATSVDYELEYQAGSLLQGAFGNIDLSTMPAQTQILLGSCSAGGACTYHEDVQGGTLVTRFQGSENYALKSNWRYFDNRAGNTEFSSKDAKFQLISKDLANQRYLIIFNTAGYPEGLEGTVVSDPYSLAVSSNLTGSAQLTMRANEEGELKIMGWDGEAWQEFTGEVDGKMIEAEVELMELYVVVK
ncbi:MAG: hypothetical protein GF390_03460 [Candidatus Pacebacteria bacterium]|nr:hypothetical protein [Candidatus Paceibacterota bacterium]